MPSIIKVDQIQSDTGTVNVSSNLQFSASSSTMQVGKALYLANTNNFALDFQADVSGRLRIASSLSTFGDNNPFIIERPSSVGGQNDAITIRAGGVVDLGKGQLKFPASQNASSDPNTLDDYEEGTWTPTFRSDGDNALITFSTSARYIKIGTYVYFTILATRNQSSVTSGTLYMQSLPFTSVSSSPTIQLGGVSWFDNGNVTTDYTTMTYVEGGSNTVYFVQFTNPSQQAASRYVQIQNLSNNRPIYITGSYTTAS